MTIQIGSNAVKTLVYELLSKDTGSHTIDKRKSLEDFEREPETTLQLRRWDDGSCSAYPTISLYHKLTKILALDELCNQFNTLPVNNWESDEYYGVSAEGEAWLNKHGFVPLGDTFNSYSGESCLSQAIQGETFKLRDHFYTLLQIHGGTNSKYGYTSAKLFRLDDEYHLYQENCSYELGKGRTKLIYKNGEWFNAQGHLFGEVNVSELVSDHIPTSETYIEGKILLGGAK